MSFCNNSYLLTSTVASAVVLCLLCGFHQLNCQKDPTTVCRFLCFSNPIKCYRFSGCMWRHQVCSTQCQSNLEAAGKPTVKTGVKHTETSTSRSHVPWVFWNTLSQQCFKASALWTLDTTSKLLTVQLPYTHFQSHEAKTNVHNN